MRLCVREIIRGCYTKLTDSIRNPDGIAAYLYEKFEFTEEDKVGVQVLHRASQLS